MGDSQKQNNANAKPLYPLAEGIYLAEDVVDLFYDRLVKFARKKLEALPPQIADDEGAVVSALRSFFSGMEAGQFPNLKTKDDMWRLLATITARKSIRQLRVHWKSSGQGRKVIHVSDIQNLLPAQNSIEEEWLVMEEFQSLIESLDDPLLKQIVYLRLEGFETADIASRLGIHTRSVQRKLQLVKTHWTEKSIES